MKKWKIVVLILAAIFVAIGSYVLYELKFKKYDIADEAVSAITEKTFEIVLPDGSKLYVDKEGNLVENTDTNSNASENTATNSASTNGTNATAGGQASNSENATNADETASGSTTNEESNTDENSNASNSNSQSAGNNSDQTSNEVKKVTAEEILQKYEPTFSALEAETTNRLNAIVGQAKAEYVTKKNNGEKISYGYFYRKYTSAAASLESSTDKVVQVVLQIVETELKANNLDVKHANGFKKRYEAIKKNMKSELMNKALSF